VVSVFDKKDRDNNNPIKLIFKGNISTLKRVQLKGFIQ